MIIDFQKLIHVCLFLIIALSWSCGHSNVTMNLSAEQHFELGKKNFYDNDYLEATNEFEVIRLQFPGSRVADSAQFFLGECHFQQEEYLLAAEEYQTLRRNMPASPLVPLAQYKIGLCYYHLSPQTELDQTYSQRAIDEFQTFVEYYPKNEMVKDAEAKIAELNDRLAKKLYDSGELYMKMDYYKAALIYYTSVIEKYHDTQFAELAQIGKIRALIARKKYGDAKSEVEKYLDKYPSGKNRDEIGPLRKDIDEHLKMNSVYGVPSHHFTSGLFA